jgi:predicted PurR-regulated permease PerM
MSIDSQKTTSTVVDVLIRVGFLFILIAWCFQILTPFLGPVLWALLISVVLHPIYEGLAKKLGNRHKLSATLITLGMVAFIIIPSFLFFDSLAVGVREIGTQMTNNEFTVPPPTEKVKDWPLIGEKTYNAWKLSSDNLDQAMKQYETQIASLGRTILSSILGVGKGVLQFVLSVIIAGVLLTYSKKGGAFVKTFFRKLVGDRGEEFATLSTNTIKNVAKGILGVAVIQTVLAGAGFAIAGIPYAGVWTMLVLVLAIVQLPPTIVFIPIIIYMYSVMPGWAATLWTIYFVAVGLSDNVLKPILLGKGATVPMLVVFLGAIGGFMAFGFIGLFVGAIVLSLGYKLFEAWVYDAPKVEA